MDPITIYLAVPFIEMWNYNLKTSCSDYIEYEIKEKLEKNLKIPLPFSSTTKKINSIKYDSDYSKRQIMYANEQKGINDFNVLSQKEVYEVSYLYLPKLKQWHQIGYNALIKSHSIGFTSSSINMDNEYIEKIAQTNNELIIYHYHPTIKNLESYCDDNISPSKLPNFLIKFIRRRNKFFVSHEFLEQLFDSKFTAAPSVQDLVSLITGTNSLKRINPLLKLSNKIVSIHGVTSYNLTDAGRDYYYNKTGTSEEKFNNSIIKCLKKKEYENGGLEYSSEHIYMKFTPHNN